MSERMSKKSPAKSKGSKHSTRPQATSRARSSPGHPVLDLQRSIGNQSVDRLLKSRSADGQITVSHPEDASERQAHRIAAQTKDSQPLFSGTDFSDVRIHNDSQAAEAAEAMNAKAFTIGNDIVFGAGQYAPHTDSGKELLTHELTHVAQQAGTTAGLAAPTAAVQREPKKPEAKSGEPRATDFKSVTMHFSGQELVVSGDKKEIFRFYARSGRPVRITAEDAEKCGANETTDTYLSDKRFVGIKDHGPIPEGTYTFSAPAIERFTTAEELKLLFGGIAGRESETIHGHAIHPGDWGSGRVQLFPKGKVAEGPCGSAKSRNAFFLHGGILAGSSGCIDVGGNFDKLADFFTGYKRSVTVTVAYTDPPPSVGFFTGLGGAIAYKHFGFTHGPTLRLGAEFAPTEARGVASLGYDAVLRWAGGAASAGLKLDVPFNDREAFVRLGLAGGLHFRIFQALYGELFGGYSWDVSGTTKLSGPELGVGLRYDFGRVQLEALYNVLRPMADDQRVHQALLGLGFRF